MSEGETEFNKVIGHASDIINLDGFGEIKLYYPSIRESKSFLKTTQSLEKLYRNYKDVIVNKEDLLKTNIEEYFVDNCLEHIVDYLEFCYIKQNNTKLTHEQLIKLENSILINIASVMEGLLLFANKVYANPNGDAPKN